MAGAAPIDWRMALEFPYTHYPFGMYRSGLHDKGLSTCKFSFAPVSCGPSFIRRAVVTFAPVSSSAISAIKAGI